MALTVPADTGLDAASIDPLRLTFAPFFDEARKWRDIAATCIITDVSQVREMRMARESRLALKDIRVKADHKRKELKDNSLRMGRAIDGFFNILRAAIVPIEEHLEKQEQFASRLEEARKTEIRSVRAAALAPYRDTASGNIGVDLAALSEEDFQTLLDGARITKERQEEAARLAEEKRQKEAAAEVLRIAEEAKAAEAERQRILAENARLAKEAEEREAASKAERKAAADKLAKERAKAEKYRKTAEAKAAKERAELEAKAKADREAREAAEAEAEALRQAQRDKEIAERRAEAERERAAAKARRAPDKEKLLAYVTALRSVALPALVTPIAQDLGGTWIERFKILLSELEKETASL